MLINLGSQHESPGFVWHHGDQRFLFLVHTPTDVARSILYLKVVTRGPSQSLISHFGSGFLIQSGDRLFLCTARHLLPPKNWTCNVFRHRNETVLFSFNRQFPNIIRSTNDIVLIQVPHENFQNVLRFDRTMIHDPALGKMVYFGGYPLGNHPIGGGVIYRSSMIGSEILRRSITDQRTGFQHLGNYVMSVDPSIPGYSGGPVFWLNNDGVGNFASLDNITGIVLYGIVSGTNGLGVIACSRDIPPVV